MTAIILFQAFAGSGLGTVSDIYLVQSLHKKFKPMIICLSIGYEALLQIVLISAHFYFKISILNLLIIFGVIPMSLAIICLKINFFSCWKAKPSNSLVKQHSDKKLTC